MPYTVALPDGRTVEFPDSVSRQEAAEIIRRQFGAAPKESTIMGEIARGGKQLVSSTRTGIGALVAPEEAATAGVARSQQIAAEAGEGPSLAALRKAYDERGLLPAAGELVSQIPRAVAGQLPQLAAMAGGAKLGAMAGTAVMPVAGTLIGGALGAGATLLPQFFGANVERQAAEQQRRGEPVDIDRAAAGAAAAGQATVEAAGTAFVLGKRVVKGILGVADDAALATAKAREELVKAAGRSRLGAAGRGAAVGLAEIPVEIAQAVIERAQAGLDVLSPEALNEYGENAYLAGLVGPTLGAATRVTEPGAARQKLAVEAQAKAGEERAAAAKAEEARKKDPAYALKLDADYQAAVTEMKALQAAVPKKPGKDALPEEQMAYKAAVDARNAHLKDVLKPLADEYIPRKAEIAQLNAQQDEQRQQAAELAALEVPQTEQKLSYYEAAQGTIPGLDAVENAPVSDEAALRSQLDRAEQAGDTEKVAQLQQQLEAFATPNYAQQIRNLTQQLEDLATQAQTTTDLATKIQLSKAYAQTDAALKAAKKAVKQTDQSAIDVLRKKMAAAEAQGDLEAQGVLAQQLMGLGVSDLGGTDLTAQTELGLGKPQALSKLKVPTDLADYEAAQQAAQQKAAEEKTAREAKQRQQQELARTAYERSQQTAGLYADLLPTIQRKAAERAAADAEAKAETERVQREEELTGKLVEATGAVQKQPAPQARMALPAGETTEGLYDQATELRAQLSFAQQTRNKALAARVQQQLQQIGASPEEKGSALDLGETARAAGVEGELTPEAMEQNRLTRLSQRQLMAYEQLVTHITRAREREQTTVDDRTKAQYRYRAEQLKQAIIGFALQEINGRRQQYENKALTQKEAMRAVTGLSRPLNELIARGAQMFEEPVVKRAKYRGARVLEGAQEFERPPAGKRTFSEASLRAASDTLREQFRQTVETVSGKPPAPPPLPGKPPGKPPGKRPESLRKVVPEQRELFLTPSPAEEAVALVPDALLEKGANKAASADDARLLRQMQEVYTQLTPEQQSVVREQAQRAADGKPLDAVYEMRGLYDLQQREAATAAGQTTFLKPITLVTARRKIERLAQQAATLEKTVREKIEALIRTGVTRGIPELEQQIKAAGVKAAPKAKTQTPLAQAQAALDRALKQGKDLVDTAQKIKADQFREISKFSEYVYTPLLETQKKLSLEWDAAVAEFATLQAQYEYTRAEFDAGRAPKTNRAELATLTRLIPQTADRIVVVTKNLDEINRLVKLAESTIAAIRERQAADTVVGPLLKDAAKAKAKIDVAQTRLDDARDLEASIARGHAQLEAEAAAAGSTLTRLLEQVESLPLTGVTRVFRDTSDPAVQALATKKRSAIAREEGTYALLEERIKAAEGDDKISLQRQLNDAEARLQTLHNELYDVYNSAPLKQVQGKTADIAASAERLEKARHAVHSAEIAAFNAQHNTSRIKLPTHKVGAVVKEKGVIKQSGERAALPKTPATIDAIVATRRQLDAISQQLAYIKANPAQTNEGKAKQAKTKKDLATKKQTLITELKALRQEQAVVVRDERAIQKARNVSKGAIRRNRLEASDAQLFEDLAKATKTQEQTLLFERAENSFGAMSATEQAYVRRQANAIVGRRVSDYKGAELAELVAAAERRKLREDESDIALSRGATENPSTTANVRAELSKAFPDLGRVQIFDSVEALIAANPEYEGRIPDDARGFVDPDTNKAFLIAENIEQGQALGVLLHEVGAHIGLKNLLGTAQYNALVKAVGAWAKKNDGSIESRVAKAAQERVEAAQTPANQKDDELLAYAIEEAVNAGVKPMETKGVLGQWLSQIAQMFRKALQKFGLPPKALDAQGLVDMAFGAAKMEMRGTGTPPPPRGGKPQEILFSRNVPTAARVANALVGKEKGLVDYLRENFLGMGFRAQFVDKLAPIEEALKKGGVSTTKALQAMYFLRMYDQRMHVTSEAITEGVAEVVEKTRKDGGTERIIQTKPGANIKQVVDILKSKDVVKAAGSADAANKLFTLYLAAIRAERVGAQTLNFGGKVTDADLKAARAEIEADPVLKKAFGEARDVYNQYNRNLLEFSVQTGALSRDVANKLLADNDYIPYYRIRDGVAQMVIGGETPIRIGNLKDSPHLKELVKGDEAIFDFLTSSVQNTAMLLDMAMKNLATKNAMFELRDVGLATISKVPKSGKTPDGAVTFKRDGEDYFAIVDTDAIGIDSDLLVKGMAGIPTMFPSIVRLLGIPARVLRRAVVASPVYMARQLFRDSLAAALTSGANIVPVLGALQQIGKPTVLRGRGITGGQVFTGMPEDVTRMLKEMQAGKVGVSSGLAWLEAKSAQADALTRQAQYQSYLDQGLSEMEATFMALESMNFSKRGLSPTMHMVSTLIPFFNAQIQGLDVLYKAFSGQMPMNERLAIREKLWTRGVLMAGMSVAYAMAMQDEEEYENAKPEEKYGNWFVRVPGFDQMVRLPIPFELGYVFKALPEALVNTFSNDKGGEEAMKAAKHFATQMVPGLSNYYLPQAVKPALEVALNKSIYTGRDIESAQEQMKEPGFRYRDNTTAAAREIGEFLNISPIKMEYLIRGYTGSMGMALLAAVSAPFGSDEGPQAATKRMSDMPVIGTLFQPKDASGIIDATYARMKEVNMVKETYDDLIEKGRIDDAREYLSTRTNEMALASVAGSFREYMGQITEYERGIKASSMTPDEKREKLDAAKQMKIRLATAVRAVADRKEPQAALD